VTYGAACSLDGYIARSDGSVDWLRFTSDVQAIMAAYWKRIDTVLMGRRTYEAALAQGGGRSGGGIRTFVFSRTLRSLPAKAGEGTELVREDAGDFVRRLKEEPGKEVCVMGGGIFARSLFGAGLIDEVGLNVHPILLGTGIPLFLDPGRAVDLELAACRTLEGGCAYLEYRVRRAPH